MFKFVFILILIEFKVFACRPELSINNTSCVFSRRSWLSGTRAAWFTSGIWRPTTTSSWFRSLRSQSTPSTSTRMPVTWRQSTVWSVPENSVKSTGFYRFAVNWHWTIRLVFLCSLALPGKLLRVEPCRGNRRGGDSADPEDQDPCT